MDIQAKKLELVQLILNTEKPIMLERVEAVLNKDQNTDWWDSISNAEQKAIQQGVEEANRGEFFSHEAVMKETKERYNLGS